MTLLEEPLITHVPESLYVLTDESPSYAPESLYVLTDEPPSYAPESLYELTPPYKPLASRALEGLYESSPLHEPPPSRTPEWVTYALILLLVMAVTVAILTVLGPQIGNVFSKVTCNLKT